MLSPRTCQAGFVWDGAAQGRPQSSSAPAVRWAHDNDELQQQLLAGGVEKVFSFWPIDEELDADRGSGRIEAQPLQGR